MNTSAEELLASQWSRQACKRPLVVSVTFASRDGVCETLEGSVKYQRGDALVTGVMGEKWPVSRDKFFKRYEPEDQMCSGTNGAYRKKPLTVIAVQLLDDLKISIDTGDELSGHPGDWLVKDEDGDYGIIQPSIFAKTYDLIT